MEANLTTLIPAIAGALLSIAFQIIPGLTDWYEYKDSKVKALIMLAAITVTGIALFGLSCISPWIYVECTTNGAWEIVGGIASIISIMFISNQTTHGMAKYFEAGAND